MWKPSNIVCPNREKHSIDMGSSPKNVSLGIFEQPGPAPGMGNLNIAKDQKDQRIKFLHCSKRSEWAFLFAGQILQKNHRKFYALFPSFSFQGRRWHYL